MMQQGPLYQLVRYLGLRLLHALACRSFSQQGPPSQLVHYLGLRLVHALVCSSYTQQDGVKPHNPCQIMGILTEQRPFSELVLV